MKKVFALLVLLAAELPILAQLSPEQQKQIDEARKKLEQLQKDPAIRQKMQMAQHMMDSLKKDPNLQQAMQQADIRLNEEKKDHPELAGIEVPDLNNVGMPNLDSISRQLNKGSQMLSSYMGALNQTMPKQNMFHHAEKLPLLSAASQQTLAKGVLKQAVAKMDPFKVTALKGKLDTCRNLAGLGAFLLANDASLNETLYIICNAILKNPKDIWSVNNLGVFYRDQLLYEPALECYFYADRLDSGKSTVLDVNIAWASLYYGDFDAATKYFDKALAIDGYFNSALEGKALMAYQRGDIQALFKCLTKEVEVMMKNVKGYKLGSRGKQKPPEPSDQFTDLCATAYLQSVLNLETQPDPTQDHSFDNLMEGDDEGQDPPPGAEEEDVTYKQYKRIFIGDIRDLNMTKGECVKFKLSASSLLNSMHKNLNRQLPGLTPLASTVQSDGKGTIVISKNFRRYVDLFVEANRLFERRVYWFAKQYRKDFEPWPQRMFTRNMDMGNQFTKDLGGCPNPDKDDACSNRVKCEWIPRMIGEGNQNLESMARIWNKYWNNIHQTIQWYIDVTGPLISRVHDEGWNSYLNNERLVAVRTAVLESYSYWADALIATPVPVLAGETMPYCPINIDGMDPPDPFSQKPEHIHEFQGPCYDENFQIGPGGVQETCHSTKYYIGYKDCKLFWETVKDPLYAQDNNYSNKVGGTIGVSKTLGIEKEDKEDKSGLKFAAGINAKAEATIWGQWNDKGQFTGAGSEVSASAEVTAEVSKGEFKLGGSEGVGIDASNTYKIVAGQLQTGPPMITVTH